MINHEITSVDGELGDLLHKNFIGNYCPNYIKVDGVILPEGYKKFSDTIDKFDVRDNDIWVCTFPKTGTTWVQEMIWCIANDMDFERAKISLEERFSFFEECTLVDYDEIKKNCIIDTEMPKVELESINYISKLKCRRFIKTHLPFNLLPRQIRIGEKIPKIISIFRNAKDTCISYYHHAILLQGYRGNLDNFCKLFIGDTLLFAPFWKHILSYRAKIIQDNVLILDYADMKKDLPSVIRKTAKFLDKNLTTDQVSILADHLSFENMKTNSAVNKEALVNFCQRFMTNKKNGSFIRNGTMDQWKLEMTPDIIKQFDDWSRKNLENTKFLYPVKRKNVNGKLHIDGEQFLVPSLAKLHEKRNSLESNNQKCPPWA